MNDTDKSPEENENHEAKIDDFFDTCQDTLDDLRELSKSVVSFARKSSL